MSERHVDRATIRKATSDDLAAMLQIERASFPDPWSEASLAEELASDLSPLVAESGGEVLGYLCLFAGPGERHVTNVAVSPPYRRKGLGRKLLEAAVEDARKAGCREVFLEVRPSNVPARRLYSELGFVELYRRRGYYIKPTEDGLVLLLSLAGGNQTDSGPKR